MRKFYQNIWPNFVLKFFKKTLNLILDIFRWGSVIFGLFIFSRETFWFDTALPELVRLVNKEQGAALLEVNPRVHYAYCNYQEDDARGGCLLSRAVSCCCCVLMTKSKEKGVILMENLKEVGLDRTDHISVWTKSDQTRPIQTKPDQTGPN
jgi:hypothetical protein